MGMVPPSIRPWVREKRENVLKSEHGCQQEWDEIKGRAQEQGLLHRDGTFANPPQGGCSISPTPRVDERLIGKEYR